MGIEKQEQQKHKSLTMPGKTVMVKAYGKTETCLQKTNALRKKTCQQDKGGYRPSVPQGGYLSPDIHCHIRRHWHYRLSVLIRGTGHGGIAERPDVNRRQMVHAR